MKAFVFVQGGARFCSAALLAGLLAPAASADWPQWRGPTRTGYAPAQARVPMVLPKELKPVWKIAVGGGHSSPVLADGKLVFLDERDGQEVVHVLEAATGKELLAVPYGPTYGDEWGSGPRATPILEGDRLYVQSCRGEFRCLNVSDGRPIWGTSYEKDFGVRFVGSTGNEGTASRRGNSGSGIIDAERIILPVGSTDGASLVCSDKNTGRVLWKSGHDEAAYSSLVVATLGGAKQVVAFNAEALLGAAVDNGKILWRVPLKTNAKRHAATPVVVGDQVVVNSHTFGMVAIKITKDSGGLRASEAWSNKDLKINIATSVLVGQHLYCQGPNKDYVCVDARTGQLKWSQPGFGSGRKDYSSTLVVGDKLLVLTEDGTLLLLAANPEKYSELGRLQVCGNTWSFPAYEDGKLFVRDGRQLLCVDLLANH